MGFVKSREELEKYYKIGVRKFFGAQMLGVMFSTKPEIAAKFIPKPLEPADAPGGLIFIANYPKTNLGPGYREGAIFLRCKYKGENGSYCLSMPITSEARNYNGRDVFGFPKKMADVQLKIEGDEAHGYIERNGVRFVEIKAKFTGSLPEMPKLGPNFLFKATPKIDLTPGFDGPVLLCRHVTDIEMKSIRIGQGEVKLTPANDDPWADIEMPAVNFAFLLTSDNTMNPGSVLGEVDGEEFLPHYWKMTDFYTGD